MRNFLIVLGFELKNYIKNRAYIVTTCLLGLLLAALLFLPRFIDMSEIFGTDNKALQEESVKTPEKEIVKEKVDKNKTMALYDGAGLLENMTLLEEAFPSVNWQKVKSEEEVRKLVREEKVENGFAVMSNSRFNYYVFNKGMIDHTAATFQEVVVEQVRQNYCLKKGINYEELKQAYQPSVEMNEMVLGKDSTSNYWYSYILVILVFMMIILYGVMIATSITVEKSNRSIEVLVTSVNSNCLLFGKVIAGAIASVVQVAFVLGLVLGSYQINRVYWGGVLDMVFQIPSGVLITFGFFGLGGFLFYAFLYGTVGALTSKTEDINKSSGGIQMVIMLVYFAVLVQLQNVDGIVIKIASFLPISSYSAMFARVAMGTVAPWEVVVSFGILVVSVVGVGILGAKIYRMGTLRYGNPIKLSHAFKMLKQK